MLLIKILVLLMMSEKYLLESEFYLVNKTRLSLKQYFCIQVDLSF